MVRDIYSNIAERTGRYIHRRCGTCPDWQVHIHKEVHGVTGDTQHPSEFKRERALDELPQSAAGKTIMTTEPKFIPEEAVEVDLETEQYSA